MKTVYCLFIFLLFYSCNKDFDFNKFKPLESPMEVTVTNEYWSDSKKIKIEDKNIVDTIFNMAINHKISQNQNFMPVNLSEEFYEFEMMHKSGDNYIFSSGLIIFENGDKKGFLYVFKKENSKELIRYRFYDDRLPFYINQIVNQKLDLGWTECGGAR
ncbi:hypothetical protein [Flavobacterium sp. CS20]|uniref:hypothetical protein n=1 Tax=Flavobacterium sp. CS20 TaxID=2775246 RepID=UPI001B3A70E4|nr:hypothetical protein [Flavobacterium sp. CS20]QTY26801.1 hypothetical protein IGB25_13130 [Flavobacterium sp. CS20]